MSDRTASSQDMAGPLAGVKVIEMGSIGPTPFAAMILADMGADVLRLDRPVPPEEPHGPKQPFLRGRRSAIVDLKTDRGRRVCLDLVRSADILIEGSRPGAMERLGVGPTDCMSVNERIVYGRMTGWGQSGPYRDMAGHDINYLSITGALGAIGPKDGKPVPPLNLVGNFGGGAMYLVSGVLAAYVHAQATGRGQVVDAAMADGVASLMTFVYGFFDEGIWVDERGSNLIDGGLPWYDVYETSDGRFMAVGALEERFYTEFTRLLLGNETVPRDDPATWDHLRSQFARAFRSRPRDEWVEVFAGTDACVTPVLTLSEARQSEHPVGRDMFIEFCGKLQPAPTPRFSRTQTRLSKAPSLPGEDTLEALADWGVADTHELLDAGVIRQTAVAPTND